MPSVRFGIRQGGKVREINDFSAFGVNATLGVRDVVDLGGLNEVVALTRYLGRVVDWESRTVSVRRKGGGRESAPWHPTGMRRESRTSWESATT